MKKALYPLLLCILYCIVIKNTTYAQAPEIQWQNTFGGTQSDYCYCVKQTNDGGYILAGTTNSTDAAASGNHGGYDTWIVKLNSSGAIQWQKTIGGTNYDVAVGIEQTFDGGYVFAGSTMSDNGDAGGNHGGYDVWVVKLSDTGGIVWQKELGGWGDDLGQAIKQTPDSGYIVAGYGADIGGDITVNHGGSDYWIIKLSPTGTLQWQRSYGGSHMDYATSIQPASDSGYIVAGYSYSSDGDLMLNRGDEDYWVIKLSPSGNLQWQRSLGGSGSDYAQSVVVAADGGYIIAGGSNSTDGNITGNMGQGDYWVVKLSASGILQWQKSFGGSSNDAANYITNTTDGGYLVSGWVSSNDGQVTDFHGSSDFWLIKLSAAGTLQWQKCMGGLGGDVGWHAEETADGGYIMAGYSSFGTVDLHVIKLAMPSQTNDQEPTNKITVSPNPANDVINISGVAKADIKLYNALGQLAAQVVNSDHVEIGTLPAGLYLIRLFNENGLSIYNGTIIKQ